MSIFQWPKLVKRRSAMCILVGVLTCASCSGQLQHVGPCSTSSTLQVTSQGVMLQAQSVTAFLGVEVVISSSPDACGRLYEKATSEASELDIFLNRVGQVGSYPIDPQWVLNPNSVGAWLAHTSSTGTVPTQAIPDKIVTAVSGTVDFTLWTPQRLAGSYDIAFSDGARAAGMFDTPYCSTGNTCSVSP